ncbi:hypothetical protein SAMN05216303_105251 [Rhodoferax sp. OV413]|uniref:DUF1415 domain-containing protein n=1 Tax=Rhodoferax sp. OV413 TaxID=1855285 RepID=UPI00088F4450|nr:DUF1415 domain-containing protein [Rhodoferax sp. OV413]SDP59500.1 hypothetical protein SAMN05216303_105251 [Rhodoferax sp. OV413]
MTAADTTVLNDMRRWLERAVIGLNLCPFAKAVHTKGQIHYAVSQATDTEALRQDLVYELKELLAQDPSARDTTLLIAPQVLADFLDYNDFLDVADRLLRKMKLDGVVQIASFHPQFQFGGTDADDITNYTNRAPYPCLHLLREASIDRAVAAFPEAEAIFERNMQTLETLGQGGWDALGVGKSGDEDPQK